jgi:hypothetical protein
MLEPTASTQCAGAPFPDGPGVVGAPDAEGLVPCEFVGPDGAVSADAVGVEGIGDAAA